MKNTGSSGASADGSAPSCTDHGAVEVVARREARSGRRRAAPIAIAVEFRRDARRRCALTGSLRAIAEGDDVAIGREALAEPVGQRRARARASAAGSRSSRACRRRARRSSASTVTLGLPRRRVETARHGRASRRSRLGDVADRELGEDLRAMARRHRADRSARRCSWRRHCSRQQQSPQRVQAGCATPAGLTCPSKLTATGAATGALAERGARRLSSAWYLVSSAARGSARRAQPGARPARKPSLEQAVLRDLAGPDRVGEHARRRAAARRRH